MSLINDMLKDLEARGDNAVRSESVRPTYAGHGGSGSRRSLLLSTGIAMLLGAGIYLAWPDAIPGAKTVDPHALAVDTRPTLEITPMPGGTVPDDNDAIVEPTANVVVAVNEEAAADSITEPEMTDSTPATVSAEEPPAENPASPPRVQADSRSGDDEGTVIVRRHEPSPEQRAQRAGRDGLAALRRGDWTTASRLLQELVELEPANDDAREGLATSLQRQGRLAEADGVLLDGIALGATPSRFAKLRARMQAARGEHDAALNSLSVAVPGVAEDPEFHALKGALAQQAGRHSLAADIYAALTEFEPANGVWQAGLAMALDRTGDRDGAREAYGRALAAGGMEPALLTHVERRLAALEAK